ncbi:MAG TPA: EF-hand domain-containing protein [Burkholderiales bacterium]|jgi:Ca2+-binding EF-hand superfamily protein
MRKTLLALAFSALAAACTLVHAQSDRAEKMRERFDARFTKADANGDGKLSKDEAKAMPRVAKNFDAIDTDHDGFVTKAEIGAAMAQARKGSGAAAGSGNP